MVKKFIYRWKLPFYFVNLLSQTKIVFAANPELTPDGRTGTKGGWVQRKDNLTRRG